jgi:hypothetical protein
LPTTAAVELAGHSTVGVPSDPFAQPTKLLDPLELIEPEWQAQIDLLNNKLTSVVLSAEMLVEVADGSASEWARRILAEAWGVAEAVTHLRRVLDAGGPTSAQRVDYGVDRTATGIPREPRGAVTWL